MVILSYLCLVIYNILDLLLLVLWSDFNLFVLEYYFIILFLILKVAKGFFHLLLLLGKTIPWRINLRYLINSIFKFHVNARYRLIFLRQWLSCLNKINKQNIHTILIVLASSSRNIGYYLYFCLSKIILQFFKLKCVWHQAIFQ